MLVTERAMSKLIRREFCPVCVTLGLHAVGGVDVQYWVEHVAVERHVAAFVELELFSDIIGGV